MRLAVWRMGEASVSTAERSVASSNASCLLLDHGGHPLQHVAGRVHARHVFLTFYSQLIPFLRAGKGVWGEALMLVTYLEVFFIMLIFIFVGFFVFVFCTLLSNVSNKPKMLF